MWTEEEVAPIPLSKNKPSKCSRSPEAAALYTLSLFAFFFFLSCSGKFKKKMLQSIKIMQCCVITYKLMKNVLVVSVFLEVTLKDYLHIEFPRGLSQLFLKISNDGDSGFPQQSTPVPDYSDD